MQKNKKNKKKQLNTYIRYSSKTIQMAVIIAAGVFLGDYFDKQNDSETVFYTITLSILSFFLALYYALKKNK